MQRSGVDARPGHLGKRIAQGDFAQYPLHVPGEVNLRLDELCARFCQVTCPLERAHAHGGDVVAARGALVGTPVEAFQVLIRLGELHHRISVVLGRLEVVYLVDVVVDQKTRQHLGLHLVHGGELAVLAHVEDSRSPSEGVETVKGVVEGVEIRHDFGALDLVVTDAVFLGNHEGVGLQAGLARTASADEDEQAVGGILAVALVPYHRIHIESRYGVDIAVNH